MSDGNLAEACQIFYETYLRHKDIKYGFDTAICYREANQVDVASILFQELVLKYPDRNDLFIELRNTQNAKEWS